MKVKDIAIARKARKGPAHKITRDGAYWLAIEIKISAEGGDGIGQSGAQIEDYLRVRHYRDGSVRAYCERDSWHQNDGSATNRTRCDSIVECETQEDLIRAIEATQIDREYQDFVEYFEFSDKGLERLKEGLPELPLAAPSPDEEALSADQGTIKSQG